jgi:archaellum component FlaG (FlaF/FlaG flagellin family)
MVNKKGVNTIVSVLLLIMITFVVASTMYFWVTRIQVESQETTTQYQEKTLGNVITEAKIIGDPEYNTLAEDNSCLPATLTFTLQNTGAKKIPITNNSEILVSDGNGPICLNTFAGTCESSEDRLYIGVNNGASNANISYSTDGSTWVQGDPNIGTLSLWESITYDEKIYYGSTYTGDPSEFKGGQTLKSCDFSNWIADNSFVWSYITNDLVVFNGKLYAATGSIAQTGRVYVKHNNATWEEVWDSLDKEVYSLTVFDDYLYAGTTDNITRSSDGIVWTDVNDTLGNATALHARDGELYVGFNGGEIWRSSDGLLFENTTTPNSYNQIDTFEVFDSEIYAAASNYTNASILKLSGPNWVVVNNTQADNIYDFAVFNNKLYAAVSGEDNAGVISSSDGTTWTYAYVGENVTTISNYTYCSNEKVSCLQGCGSDLVPGETRVMELQLSNTNCDMTQFGTSTEYKFRINFGSSASVASRFGKELISSSSNSRCEYTYPFCNGVCDGGSCIAAPLGQMCMCVPSELCQDIDTHQFACSTGTGCGELSCTFNVDSQQCECL